MSPEITVSEQDIAAVDYEVEYNNRARVPEHPDIIAGWVRDAAAYRELAECELDLRYDKGARCTLDLFYPANGHDDAPLALFIHGGYWQAMDGKTFSSLARGLNRHGISVAIPTYDLCPDVTVGDIVDEMRACCVWLWKRHERPLTVFGHSAGGHLTAAMVATDWPAIDASLPQNLCVRGYAISGLFELAPLVETSINGALSLDTTAAQNLSPLTWPVAHATHLTAAVGGLESPEFLRQSKTVCETWRRHGVETAYREMDGKDHFTVISDLADPDSTMVREIVELARREVLKGP